MICFLGFKRRNTSRCFFPFQAINYFKQQPRKLCSASHTFPHFGHVGPMAERTRATPEGGRGGTHPLAGQSPLFKFYFHLGEGRENYRQAKRGLHNLVLRHGTRPAPGQWLFQSRLLRTACQTDALARTELQSHAAGTGPIAIEDIKNNAPQHVWAFPISPAALLPAVLALASPHRFCTLHSSTSSFPPAVPSRRPRSASP